MSSWSSHFGDESRIHSTEWVDFDSIEYHIWRKVMFISVWNNRQFRQLLAISSRPSLLQLPLNSSASSIRSHGPLILLLLMPAVATVVTLSSRVPREEERTRYPILSERCRQTLCVETQQHDRESKNRLYARWRRDRYCSRLCIFSSCIQSVSVSYHQSLCAPSIFSGTLYLSANAPDAADSISCSGPDNYPDSGSMPYCLLEIA